MTEISGTRSHSAVDHVDAMPVGTRLGEFEIVGLLGVGGFGMVYQAFDHSLLRFVAIKEYMPTTLAGRTDTNTIWVRSTTDRDSFQAGLASFVDEARLLAQFDHPSLVKVFRFWEANQTAYMVMPLYAGMTLKQARAHMRTPPSEQWLRALIWSACSGLRVLHDGKTLHRDISPDNIFLQDIGPPVLLDLGAARFAIEDREHRHTAVLKVNYAPIEQYSDADSELKAGPWSDIYSLAAVIYGVICNDMPLPATLRSIRDRMVPFTRVARTVRKQFGIEYSAPFVETIAKALSLQPRDRHWSVDAFLEQMGMTSAPTGLHKFDFRAELGANWIDPQAQSLGTAEVLDLSEVSETENVAALPEPQALVEPASSREPGARAAKVPAEAFKDTVARSPEEFSDSGETSFAETRLFDPDDTEFAEAAAKSVVSTHEKSVRKGQRGRKPSVKPSIGGAAPARRKASGVRRALLLSSVLMALVGGAAAWYVSTQTESLPKPELVTQSVAERTPDEEILTELAEPVAEEEMPAVHHDPASGASSVPVHVTVAGASMVPAFVVAKDPKPRAAPQVRKPPESSVHAQVELSAAPAQAPAPAVLTASQAAPARRPNPEDVCANSGFLAKPMCIHNQCQKPGMAGHPVCVEARRKRDEERQQRQNFSQ